MRRRICRIGDVIPSLSFQIDLFRRFPLVGLAFPSLARKYTFMRVKSITCLNAVVDGLTGGNYLRIEECSRLSVFK